MHIIKNGKIEGRSEYLFSCKKCGTRFAAKREECKAIERTINVKTGVPFKKAFCPRCKSICFLADF